MNQGAYEVGLEETDVGLHTFSRARDRLRGQRRPAGAVHLAAHGRPRDLRRRPRLHARERRPRRRPATGGPTMSSTATISFTVNVADATFECQLDLEPYEDVQRDLRPGHRPVHGHVHGPHRRRPCPERLRGARRPSPRTASRSPPSTSGRSSRRSTRPAGDDDRARARARPTSSSTFFEFTGTDDLTPTQLLMYQCQVVDGTACAGRERLGRLSQPVQPARRVHATRTSSSRPASSNVLRACGRPRRPGGPEPAAAGVRGQPGSDARDLHVDADRGHAGRR